MNVIALQMALAGRTPSDANPELEAIDAVCVSMRDTPADFWSVVGQTEMAMYKAIVKGQLAEERVALERDFTNHHQKVPGQKRWATIYDNATLVLSTYRRRATTTPVESDAALALLTRLAQLAKVRRSTPGGQPPLAADPDVSSTSVSSGEMPLNATPSKRRATPPPAKTAKRKTGKVTTQKTRKAPRSKTSRMRVTSGTETTRTKRPSRRSTRK